MLARILECGGLTCFGALSVMDVPPAGGVAQWGGWLALVAFMVAQNYRQRERMAKTIEDKDKLVAKANAASARLSVAFTEAVNRNSEAIVSLAATLEKRPCALAKDEDAQPRVTT